MMTLMRKLTLITFILFLCEFTLASSEVRDATVESSIPQIKSVPVGLDLEFLVPNNLAGLSLPQTLTGAHFGASIGEDTLQLSAFYGSNQETSTLILSEIDYRFNLYTPFLRAYALAGLHYIHFRLAQVDKEFVGPVVGLGLDLPMAESFRMGLQMKLYSPKKTMIGFGGGFSFLL